MKKIVLFFLLSFFISSVSYSRIITFKDCYFDLNYTLYDVDPEYKSLKKFDKKMYEETKYEIDLVKKEIKEVIIITDHHLAINKKYLDKEKERIRSIESSSGKKYEGYVDQPRKKIDIQIYPLTHTEKNYIISTFKLGETTVYSSGRTTETERTMTFYLKEKKITTTNTYKYNWRQDETKQLATTQCN